MEEPLSMSQKKGLIPTSEMDVIPNAASSLIGAKIAPNYFKNPMIIQNYLFLYHFVLELSNGLS